MCWVWYLLAMHPWAEARLHAELDAALGGRAPSVEDLAKLSYLRQVVDETMRLYPPVPVMLRTVARTTQSAAIRCGMARRSSLRPGSFTGTAGCGATPTVSTRPLRARHNRIAVALCLFAVCGGGRGPAIAAPLAIMQIHIAVAMLAQRFRFHLVPGHRSSRSAGPRCGRDAASG